MVFERRRFLVSHGGLGSEEVEEEGERRKRVDGWKKKRLEEKKLVIE